MTTKNPLDPISFALFTHHVLSTLGDYEVGRLDATARAAMADELTGLFRSLSSPQSLPAISVGTLRLVASPLGTALLGNVRSQPAPAATETPNFAVYIEEAGALKVASGSAEDRRQRVARLRALFERVAERAAHDLVPSF